MKGRVHLAVVVGLWTFTVALVAVAATLITVNRPNAYDLLFYVPEVLAFITAGSLVAWRRPRNPAGWLLTAVGLVWTVVSALQAYVHHALAVGRGGTPMVELAAWVANWVWVLAFLALSLFLLLFPDGRLPGPMWRGVVGVGVVGAVLVFAGRSAMPGPLAEFPSIVNPYGVPGAGTTLTAALAAAHPLIGVTWIASIASLFVRYRRVDGVQRLQLRWMVLAATVYLAASLADVLPPDDTDHFLAPIAGVPVAAAIAILRYRLYEVDRVVSKTVVYALLAAFVSGVYLVVAVGAGAAIGTDGKPNLALSVLATAVVAVAFQPVRAGIERVAHRLVYGRHSSPYDVLAGFSRRLVEPVATEALLPEMARTLAEGTGATEAAVWLAVGHDLRQAAVWPVQPAQPVSYRLGDNELPAEIHGTSVVPVRHQEELLGALTVTKPAGESLTPAEDKLLSDLAAQAGLALRNVRLIEELKASRQRIVAAQDDERRRLERDIHDGAQQRLVTLSLALRMARARPGLPPGLAAALATATRELNDCLIELRELARGIHPAILSDEGLGPALAALAERSAIVTTVSSVPVARLPAPVEATAYQVASHALAAATQAGASSAKISAEQVSGRIVVEVRDDGSRSTTEGWRAGLFGLDDRVAALNGRLEVVAPLDRGAVVRAVIPCESS